MPENNPLLLGMTGFWGTPIANDKCRTADLILAVGTRLAEANSSSRYPEYNAGFGTIAGLEAIHYGWEFGCMFHRDGKEYRADYAAMARSFGARGVMIKSTDELGPALREALASNLPIVIQAAMENAPTPTPGHWNIMDIYRKGE